MAASRPSSPAPPDAFATVDTLAELIILYWRDIPSQVIVKQGRAAAKRELPKRFIEAIDAAAMRAGAAGTEAYLNDWRREPAGQCGDDLEAEAAAAAARIEGAYDRARVAGLVAQGGREGGATWGKVKWREL